jgi:hypothetical protein
MSAITYLDYSRCLLYGQPLRAPKNAQDHHMLHMPHLSALLILSPSLAFPSPIRACARNSLELVGPWRNGASRRGLYFSFMSCLFSLLRSAPSPREELELWCNLVRGEGWGEENHGSRGSNLSRFLIFNF